MDELLAYAAREVAKPEEPEVPDHLDEPKRFVIEVDFEVTKENGIYRVEGAKVKRLASMTNFDQQEAQRVDRGRQGAVGVECEHA